jgi:predicted DNA-binding ribbon-helix-helix protein
MWNQSGRVWVRPRLPLGPDEPMHRARLPVKTFILHGHPTSVRLEPELWKYLRVIAAEIGTSAAKLIETIAIVRSHDRSLSSELRVFIAKYFADQSPRYGFFDPDSRFAFRVVDDRPRRKRRTKLAA